MKTTAFLFTALLLFGCVGVQKGDVSEQNGSKVSAGASYEGELPEGFDLDIGIGSMPELPNETPGLDAPKTYVVEEPDFGSII